MQLARVVETIDAVTATSKRSQKVACLAELLLEAPESERRTLACWLSGRLRQGRIGVGWRALQQAAGEATPAEATSLTVASLDKTFTEVAGFSGKGSTGRRREAMQALFAAATHDEQQYLFRLVSGAVRQGALEGMVVSAVAKAAGRKVKEVRRALMLCGDIGEVTVAALSDEAEALDAITLELFRPVQPMLAQTAETPEEVLELLGEAVFEHKLDGARVQVHKQGGEVRVFSRQLNDVTAAVPEVVELVAGLPVQRCILDGEVLALQEDGSPHPFQVTMRRFGRRLDVEAARHELPLSVSFFDILVAEDAVLLDRPLRDRRDALRAATGGAASIGSLQTADAEAAATFYDDAMAWGHEGVMAKGLDTPYEAGGRGKRWFKLKPTHTLDLVVLAVEWGSGRRRGWLSNLHLGARDGDGFQMLGKTFKGLTDELLRWQTKTLGALETHREGHVVHVRPELVVEIAFNEVQDSPHYASGLALRFARVKRYRPDKSAAEADTYETVKAIRERGFRAS